MDVNNLEESSFASATSHLQAFGRIGMASAAAISDMERNGLLDQPTTNKDISDNKTSMFHDLPEELYITNIMCAVQEVPAARQSNTDAIDRRCNSKQERDKLVNW